MQDYQYYLTTFGEYGEVDQVNTPILIAKGLPYVKLRELVLFETGQKGWVIGLNRDSVTILLFSQEKIPVGTKVVRTQTTLSIPVGDHLLGMLIDPLGNSLDDTKLHPVDVKFRPVDTRPPGIKSRARITRPFKTGTTLVDMMIPLGKGQKELVMGDRKTGKSAFVLNTIKKQIKEGTVAIYCIIGKKKSDIKAIEELLIEEGLRDKVVVVASSAYDPASTIYVTPFASMTLAEYFAEQGKDVLIILDDLYAHARFYRELSLVSNNFPGRDSYPGDIFYTHARLLERAGNFKHPAKGEVSITCLPVVETIEGDITGYIQTNLMGITDGHILFDSEIFYNGRRPAINVHISVTRAGRQTQSQLNRDITRELTAFLTLYERMQDLSHFGTELTDNVINILKKGDTIFSFFEQPFMAIVEEQVQLILFSLIWVDQIKEIEKIPQIRTKLQKAAETPETKALFDSCFTAKTFNDFLQNVLTHKDQIMKLWQ